MLRRLFLASVPLIGAVLRSASSRLDRIAQTVDPAGSREDVSATVPAPPPLPESDEIEESDYDRLEAIASAGRSLSVDGLSYDVALAANERV